MARSATWNGAEFVTAARALGLPALVGRRFAVALRLTGWRLAVTAATKGGRLLDVLSASILLVVMLPVFAALSLLMLFRAVRLERETVSGEAFRSFDRVSLRGGPWLRRFGLHRLPDLGHVLRGEMSIVGPRPALPIHLDARSPEARLRQSAKPGLVCLWWLRSRANIDFGTELDADLEYVESRRATADAGILLRALLALLYGRQDRTSGSVKILGIPIHSVTMDGALERIEMWLSGGIPRQICFVNADCANIAMTDARYLDGLRRADMVLADGIGMRLAGQLLGSPVAQNLNGTDLFPRLCALLESDGKGLFLLGARPGVADAVRGWIESHFPALRVCGARDGYFDESEEAAVLHQIRSSGASVLLVAMGVPRQDLWIARNLEHTGVQVAIGVGGLFDFYSGRIPRAPQWMRELSIEWTYRLWQEPGRMWKRYLVGNLVFMTRVLTQRIRQGRAFRGSKGEPTA